MSFVTVKVKSVSSEITTGCIINDYDGTNTIGFLAKLPKSAIIDRIRVDGTFLNDLDGPVIVKHCVDKVDGDYRVAAIVYFSADAPNELIDKISNHIVTDFDVYYHDEALVKVE